MVLALSVTPFGCTHLRDIYVLVEQLRDDFGLKLNPTWHATVRRTLQQSSRCSNEGLPPGWWKLARPNPAETDLKE